MWRMCIEIVAGNSDEVCEEELAGHRGALRHHARDAIDAVGLCILLSTVLIDTIGHGCRGTCRSS
jgi:hypothetical protein